MSKNHISTRRASRQIEPLGQIASADTILID